MTALATTENRAVARPLNILTPLIKEDIQRGDEAGMEWYVQAGEKLLEAKTLPRFKDGGFRSWAKKTFNRSDATLSNWMDAATATNGKQNASADFSSVREAYERALATSHF